MNCLSVFDHSVDLALKELRNVTRVNFGALTLFAIRKSESLDTIMFADDTNLFFLAQKF